MNKRKSLLPYVLLLAALGLFAYYLYRNAESYLRLLDISWRSLGSMAFLVIVSVLINGAINYRLYRALGVPVTRNEAVGLSAVNSLANQLPFAGGMLAKGVYLNHRHRLAYTNYFGATLALYVCFLAANGILGLALLGFWELTGRLDVPPVLWLGFGAMLAGLLLLRVPIRWTFLPRHWIRRFNHVTAGWQTLSQTHSLVVTLVALQILMTIFISARFWFAFHILSQNVSLAQCLLFATATILTQLVSIAPGGLGVREGIVAILASLLGFDFGVSVVAVGMDRLLSTTLILSLGTIYSYVLARAVSLPSQENQFLSAANDIAPSSQDEVG